MEVLVFPVPFAIPSGLEVSQVSLEKAAVFLGFLILRPDPIPNFGPRRGYLSVG